MCVRVCAMCERNWFDELKTTSGYFYIKINLFFPKQLGEEKQADIPNEWLDLKGGCLAEVRRQIQAEIDASMSYLAMGAHFAQDTVNRLGFSEFFIKASGEEREHATKLIEYLLMRGQLTDDVSNLIKVNVIIRAGSLLSHFTKSNILHCVDRTGTR